MDTTTSHHRQQDPPAAGDDPALGRPAAFLDAPGTALAAAAPRRAVR